MPDVAKKGITVKVAAQLHAERAPFEAATSDSATVSQVTRTVPKSHQLQIIIAGLAVIAVVIVKIYF